MQMPPQQQEVFIRQFNLIFGQQREMPMDRRDNFGKDINISCTSTQWNCWKNWVNHSILLLLRLLLLLLLLISLLLTLGRPQKSWSKRMAKPRFSLDRYSSKQVSPVYGQYEGNMGEKRVPAESYAKYRLDMRKFKL